MQVQPSAAAKTRGLCLSPGLEESLPELDLARPEWRQRESLTQIATVSISCPGDQHRVREVQAGSFRQYRAPIESQDTLSPLAALNS